MRESDSEDSWQPFAAVFDPLLDNRSDLSNEALAALVAFHLDKNADEDVTCELVARGRSVLPALKKFRHREILISDKFRAIPTEATTLKYDWVIEQIESGEWCNRQP